MGSFEGNQIGSNGKCAADRPVKIVNHVDHAFLASADHLEAVVGVGDATGHERWREFQHHVPAMVMMLVFSFHGELNSTTGSRFQIASDLRHWIIFLSEC